MFSRSLIHFKDMEYESLDSPEQAKLTKLLSLLYRQECLSYSLLCERLEPRLLQAADIITSSEAFTTKQVRINTSMLYKQQKFNLLREESEGYAKIISIILFDATVDGGAMVVYEKLITLIGILDLAFLSLSAN